MSIEVKRMIKKVLKRTFWIAGDVFFLGLKVIGTVFLVAITTATIFAALFLYYVRTNLADDLEINPAEFLMAQSSVIYLVDRDTGREIEMVTIQSTEFRRWVDFDEFPQHLIDALIAIEDHRFWDHSGVDWYRTVAAFFNMFLGMENTFGGSTITQQVIKNLTMEDDVTIQRKLQEIFRAIEYERQFSKEEILELYLNLVYFGHGAYGIGAAALYYFDKDVPDLTVYEAAAIIGITNNPSRFSPYRNRTANKERQEIILNRMFELGYIETREELRQAIRANLNFQRGIDDDPVQIIYSWFEEAVIRDVLRHLVNELDLSEQAARGYLFRGGLRIIATIDPQMQAIVDEIYMNPELLPVVTGSAQQLQSSIIIADPYTGEIRALSGGVGIKSRNMLLNRATQTRRPPGSSIKPVSVYAPALDIGMFTPDTLYLDSPSVVLSGTTWFPRNATNTFSGMVTVRHSLRQSLNTVPAIMLDQLSVYASYSFMTNEMGFDLSPADADYSPLAAGQLTHGATVREMASAYTMFPNSGYRVELRTFSRIYDSEGNILIDNSVPNMISAISDVTAHWMTDMLIDAVVSGTGRLANLPGMPTAGKTGTSNNSQDRWFVGFTPHYLAAVWTGFDTPARMTSQGNPAAQIWRLIMEPIHENLESRQFNRPENVSLTPVIGRWGANADDYGEEGYVVESPELPPVQPEPTPEATPEPTPEPTPDPTPEPAPALPIPDPLPPDEGEPDD